MPRARGRCETMDIRLLEYLLQIEKQGNISKAAQEIHISQSALSQNLAKIEASLNTNVIKIIVFMTKKKAHLPNTKQTGGLFSMLS